MNKALSVPTAILTRFLAPKDHCLSKTFGINKDTGKLEKKKPGVLAWGSYTTFELSLEGLRDGFIEFNSRKCICLGNPDRKSGEITTKKQHIKKGEPANPIPRNKQHFKHRHQSVQGTQAGRF